MIVGLSAAMLTAGQFSGRVYDPSGAVVRFARVKVSNLVTGVNVSTQSTADGS